MQSPITITDAAKARIKELLEKRGKPSAGIRIALKTAGCSGLSYTVEYADEANKFDEVVTVAGEPKEGEEDSSSDCFNIYIEPKATLFIIGTEMDYVTEKMKSGFVFRNPNEKGRCGCGKSFHV